MKKALLHIGIFILFSAQIACSHGEDEPEDITTISVNEPGSLSEIIAPSQRGSITKLSVKGSLNYSDISYIHQMPELLYLDVGNVVLPNNYFPDNAISSHEKLEAVILPVSLDSIGASAFRWCERLQAVRLPKKLKSIGAYAFAGCINLYDIELPNSLLYLEKYAFCLCFGLETVIIGNGVTQIEQSTFHFCPNLKHIALGNNTTSIGAEAFLSCDSLKYIELPNSISEIGKNAFSSCDALSSITLSENLSEIKEQTFSNCTSLSSIIIPDKVSTIATSAFSGCNHLVSLRLGTGVTDISYWAFKSAPLKEIYAFSETPPTVHYTNSYTNSFDADIFNQCTLYVPAGSLQAYKNAEVWKNFKNIVENDFTGIERPSPDKAKIFGNKNSIAFRNIEPGTDISIYDTTGKCIKTFAVDGDSEIPFPSGIYLIKYAGKTVKIIL